MFQARGAAGVRTCTELGTLACPLSSGFNLAEHEGKVLRVFTAVVVRIPVEAITFVSPHATAGVRAACPRCLSVHDILRFFNAVAEGCVGVSTACGVAVIGTVVVEGSVASRLPTTELDPFLGADFGREVLAAHRHAQYLDLAVPCTLTIWAGRVCASRTLRTR